MDAARAGVFLVARFDLADPPLAALPQKVRFFRGDGTLVRSGDPAWAPGGIAIAYDHEAPVGAAASYYAVPIDRDGTAGAQTAGVTVLVPAPQTYRDVWIKSPINPNISALAWVENPPEITEAGNVESQRVPGSRLGTASWDVRSGRTLSFTLVTTEAGESDALRALLDAGPLLVQTRPDYDFTQGYFLPGDVTRTRVGRMSNLASRWDVTLTECRRPATLDAPLRVPGNSYADTDPDYPTYAEATATGTTYLQESTGAAG